MKKINTIIILLALGYGARSQAFNASYTYDANGNRITATVIWLTTSLLKSDRVDDSVGVSSTINGNAAVASLPPTTGNATTPTIDSLAGTKITVYPNPTKGQLQIKLDGFDRSINSNQSITIYDVSGIKIMEIKPVLELNTVDLLLQPMGTYIMVIQLGSQSKTYSIIKN
jgi:hypothetical protein